MLSPFRACPAAEGIVAKGYQTDTCVDGALVICILYRVACAVGSVVCPRGTAPGFEPANVCFCAGRGFATKEQQSGRLDVGFAPEDQQSGRLDGGFATGEQQLGRLHWSFATPGDKLGQPEGV